MPNHSAKPPTSAPKTAGKTRVATASSTAKAPATKAPTFAALGVDPDLVADLKRRGFTAPFPIQSATLPDTLAGSDVLGRGRTGSGKTLAFSLPLVQRLAAEDCARPGHPIGLVLAPTRELASQIAEVIEPLAAAVDMTVTTLFGGVSQKPQEKALAQGVDVIVACPGRLLDLMNQGVVALDEVGVTVIDEADHMADLGFLPSVRRILRATPARGQRMLFSATLDNGVDKLVDEFLHRPVQHAVDSDASPVASMEHRVWLLADKTAKDGVMTRLASGTGQRILFTRTKHLARRIARKLVAHGIPAVELQGNMSQNARERAMRAFSSGQVHVMVATDIAARGIDVSGVELVVHVDPPAEHKAYLHRSGRTARAGAAGVVVTLVLPEQRKDVEVLLKKAKIKAQIERIRPDADAVAALVGQVAEPVALEEMPEGVAIKGGPVVSAKAGTGRRPAGRSAAGRGGRSAKRGGAKPSAAKATGGRTAKAGHSSAGAHGSRSAAPKATGGKARGTRPAGTRRGGTSYRHTH
ncbi:ATP-dependent RNA helicase rhlE [Actinomyces bovis]|uniref:ATP-dependent RNA helicase rhlE n=1 Tax=Actinomyces bovis TaxID=1658 RepID=A0ABY1VN25_9ACTO|nr:DEAD/DEAH box helicase [Actinomyces bovis]SPT53501.1 ATP-dependent RNA helicase rhlE [Actinomyces bovis]VEG55416.1 ATP-dependent RNA helicase rhlE [Actinomyces israelii]